MPSSSKFVHVTYILLCFLWFSSPAVAQDASQAPVQPPVAAVPQPATNSQPILIGVAAFVAANAADTAMTYHLLTEHSAGLHETNPLLSGFENHPKALVAVKTGAAVTAAYFLMREHGRHPKLTLWTSFIGAAAYSWLTWQNYRLDP